MSESTMISPAQVTKVLDSRLTGYAALGKPSANRDSLLLHRLPRLLHFLLASNFASNSGVSVKRHPAFSHR